MADIRSGRLLPALACGFGLAVVGASPSARAQEGTRYPTIDFSARIGTDYVSETVEAGGSTFKGDDADISSIRLGVSGDVSQRISYSVSANVAEGDLRWAEASVRTDLGRNTTLTMGQTKTVSLGNLTSGRATSFIERGAFNDTVGVGRQLAILGRKSGPNWTVSAALLGDNMNNPERNEHGYSARGAYTPIRTARQVLHIGAWTRHRERDAAFGYAFSDTFDSGAPVSGSAFRTREDTAYAVEGAWINGPITVQSELAQIDARGPAGGKARAVRTGYLSVGWLVTGGGRAYDMDQGRIGLPNRVRQANGLGVVELGARFDRVDFAPMAGPGGYQTWTFGVSWYGKPWMRLSANYTLADASGPAGRGPVEARKFHLRAQADF